MKRILSLILILALVLILPVGCGDSATTDSGTNSGSTDTGSTDTGDTGDTGSTDTGSDMSDTYLVWNIGADPRTFDPGLNNASDGGDIIQNLFEGLYIDGQNGLEPGQAESYTLSDDGKTYTFKLREGLMWSDGQPLTAKDFEYAWKRVCDPNTASEYSFIVLPYLKNAQKYYDGEVSADEIGVTAKDDTTLVVELENPCSYFMNLVSFYTYFPVRQDIIEANGEGWEKDPMTCVSNGPFMLEDYQIGSHLDMKKNPNYRQADMVKLAGIHGLMIAEATTALNGYQAGQIQVNGTIPSDQIPNLVATDPNFTQEAQIGTYYVIFNCDKAPMNDVRVRKAMAMAIDRKLIVEQVTKGGQIPATGFIPPNLAWSDGTSCRELDANGMPVEEFGIEPNSAKIDEAKKLLAEAGFPEGEGFPTLVYLYNTSEGHQKIGEALQEMWKNNLGIEITLENEEWATFQQTRQRGDFDVSRGGWLGDYSDPMTMLDLWTSYSGNNDAQWRWEEEPITAPHDKILNPENKAFDEAIAEAMISSGTTKDDAYKKAEQIMIGDEMIVAPIYYYTNLFVIDQTKVIGVTRTKMGQWMFKEAMVLE